MKEAGTTKKGESEDQRFLIFALSDEVCAVPLAKVREVIALGGITKVPNTPAHFRGIMNLRGQLISIIDLRVKFRLKEAPQTAESAIIILELKTLCIGIIIDFVEAVQRISSKSIDITANINGKINSNYITGVARLDERILHMLDIEKALNIEDQLSMSSIDSKEKTIA